MNNIHAMRVPWPYVGDYTKEECIDFLVDGILAKFPDANVLSSPEVLEEDDGRWIEQRFTSEFFNEVSNRVAGLMIDEMHRMLDVIHKEKNGTDWEDEYVNTIACNVMTAAIEHLSHIFLGEGECDE